MKQDEMSSSRLDSERTHGQDSRMAHDRDKSYQSRRTRCEADIVTMLRNIDGPAPLHLVLGVYHLHYAPHRDGRSTRWTRTRTDRASEFLRRMEDAGLIVCTYDSRGIVLEARVK